MLPSADATVRQVCAEKLRALWEQGIAVIPLQGKRPSFFLRWKRYQKRLPTEATIESWQRAGFESYGIICGAVSGGLFVIDFDDAKLYAAFCRAFPHLSDGRTVQTRRGYHVYLRADFPVAARRFQGCDIKGEVGYVVGPGSQVAGHRYRLCQSGAPLRINYRQYREILAWLCPPTAQQPPSSASGSSPANLVERYQKLALEQGRNNALYTIARQARARGLPLSQTIQTLSAAHATMQSVGFHAQETLQQRLKEAHKTIKSAYRALTTPLPAAVGLPNSVREALLQRQKSSIGARLLDAISRHAQSGAFLMGKELLEIAKTCCLSKKSLMRALAGDLAKIGKKRIFKRFAFDSIDTIYPNARKGDNGKPIRKRGRRPQFIYQIPSIKQLCQLLQVEMSHTDKLEEADLCSASAYRLAMHRELLRRLSAVAPVKWLAQRLGVHRRTIFRYNQRLGVEIKPTIQRNPLNLAALAALPAPESGGFTPGLWLETATGKRFPALKTIATRLLALGGTGLTLCRQLPSRYILPPAAEERPVSLPEHLKARAKKLVYEEVHALLPPDWASKKYQLGGYLAVFDGADWVFRPPLRSLAYQLTRLYEAGLVYYIKPLKA